MFANFVRDIQHIAVYQFGFLIYWIQYSPDTKSQNYVSDKLSIINFVANFLSLPMNAGLAWLIIKDFKCWKLLLGICFLLMSFNGVFVMTSKQFYAGELVAGEYGSWLQDVSFTLLMTLGLCYT